MEEEQNHPPQGTPPQHPPQNPHHGPQNRLEAGYAGENPEGAPPLAGQDTHPPQGAVAPGYQDSVNPYAGWHHTGPDTFEDVEDAHPMLKTREGFAERVESDLFYGLQNLVLTLVIIVLTFSFVGRVTQVKGDSMMPTLTNNEMLLVWSLGYRPKVGDIVIVNKLTADYLGGDSIVKRVIALEGQTVFIDYPNNQVLVDGVPLDEPYLAEAMYPIYGEQTQVVVPKDSIFVLGDNRNGSSDSRDPRLETIHQGYVMGKAVFGIYTALPNASEGIQGDFRLAIYA